MSEPQTDLKMRYQNCLMNTYGVPSRIFVRGKGTKLYDVDNNCYTDMLSGIAVNVLGHAHPEVSDAIARQLRTLDHISNYFASPVQIELAEKLAEIAKTNCPNAEAKVFFTNSGTEANEAALKLTRLTGRKKIVAMEGGFHGRTMGALSITHNLIYRQPFVPLIEEIEFVEYGNIAALRQACDDSVAAIVLEPIQGESGVIDPGDNFLIAARQIATANNILLWIDEVQTGIGRCGQWFSHLSAGISADIVTVAKGLANGYPIGACIALGSAAELFQPGHHGTTFGGNPVAAAAGLAVLKVIESNNLLSCSKGLGEYLVQELNNLNQERIKTVRGRGLLRGIVLNQNDGSQIVQNALNSGWVINAPRPNILRICPPLIITRSEIDEFVTQFFRWLK